MHKVKDFDMSALSNSLRVNDDHRAFAHGQLKKAASGGYSRIWLRMGIPSSRFKSR